MVKYFTCFKSTSNPSCIDLFVTNSSNSFQCTKTISTGLSDFHTMIATVLKATFPKIKPTVLLYRNYSKFVEYNFYTDIEEKITKYGCASFHNIFHGVLNNHAPHRKKFIRANQK